MIIIIITLFQEGNTIRTELTSLAAPKYLQTIQINNDMYDSQTHIEIEAIYIMIKDKVYLKPQLEKNIYYHTFPYSHIHT